MLSNGWHQLYTDKSKIFDSLIVAIKIALKQIVKHGFPLHIKLCQLIVTHGTPYPSQCLLQPQNMILLAYLMETYIPSETSDLVNTEAMACDAGPEPPNVCYFTHLEFVWVWADRPECAFNCQYHQG